jgi:hypothetical protein
MIAEAAVPSRSVPDAAQAVRRSLDRVRMNQRGYARVRLRASPVAVARARTDWGLAVLEWIEASVTLAEAEDTRDPGRAAGDSRTRRITVETGPARDRIESSWRRYQQVRKNGSPAQVTQARAQWREALVDWFQALAEQRAAEDGQRARALRPGPEPARPELARPEPTGLKPTGPESTEPESTGPEPTEPEPTGPPPDPAAPAPPRGQPRYPPLAAGWAPAKRAPGA